jgi:small subunit ribosomal protein S20
MRSSEACWPVESTGGADGPGLIMSLGLLGRRWYLACVANIKSQIKRNKTNERARLRNKAEKSSLKTAVKKFRTAAEAGDSTSATALLRDASRELDKAASKGVIHKNQAANRKSALAKRLSKLSA